MKHNSKLAVIVPTFNRLKDTRSIIQQLQQQVYSNFQIIICDSGSTDGTQNLNKEFPEIVILNVGTNKWWTGATNAGIRYAKEKGFSLVLLMNDDLNIPTDLLKHLISYYHTYPDALLTTMQRDFRGKLYIGSLFKGIFRERVNIANPQPRPLFIDCSNGCCILIPSQIFNIIGLTDDSEIPHLGGDLSIYLRARNLGIKCIVIPEVVIQHTSTTNYINKAKLQTIFTHPGSALHFRTYIKTGYELYGSLMKFTFLGAIGHYRFIKEILITFFVAFKKSKKLD